MREIIREIILKIIPEIIPGKSWGSFQREEGLCRWTIRQKDECPLTGRSQDDGAEQSIL